MSVSVDSIYEALIEELEEGKEVNLYKFVRKWVKNSEEVHNIVKQLRKRLYENPRYEWRMKGKEVVWIKSRF